MQVSGPGDPSPRDTISEVGGNVSPNPIEHQPQYFSQPVSEFPQRLVEDHTRYFVHASEAPGNAQHGFPQTRGNREGNVPHELSVWVP
jgi:hypothetical protein